MSFDWNPSSEDEDEDGFVNWTSGADLQSTVDRDRSNSNDDDSSSSFGEIDRFDPEAAFENGDSTDDDENDNDNDNDNDKKPAAVAFEFDNDDGSFGLAADGDNDDGVDWEDADENDSHRNDAAQLASDRPSDPRDNVSPPMIRLRPVTLDLHKDGGRRERFRDKDKTRKKRTRKSYRFDRLPDGTKHVITNMQKSHLLCLTTTAANVSKQCSDETTQNLAYSLLPERFLAIDVPTVAQLADFSTWFFDLVNNADARRHDIWNRIARARSRTNRHPPSNDRRMQDRLQTSSEEIRFRTNEYCAFLALSLNDNPDLEEIPSPNPPWGAHDKVQLLVSMARALGWRARFVMTIDPIKGDLDIHHPLVMQDHVQQLMFNMDKIRKRKRKHKCRKVADTQTAIDLTSDGENENNNHGSSELEASTPNAKHQHSSNDSTKQTVVWAEVMCQIPDSHRNSNRGTLATNDKTNGAPMRPKWIHIQPDWGLFNQPKKVEYILYAVDQMADSESGLARRKGNDSSSRNASIGKNSNYGVIPVLPSRRRPIAYALAVEHKEVAFNHNNGHSDSEENNGERLLARRLQDVTPRYASSYVESMKAVGVLRGKQTKVKEQEHVHKWWMSMLKSLSDKPSHRIAMDRARLKTKGKTEEDAIDLSAPPKDPPAHRNVNDNTIDHEDDDDEHEKAELSQHAKNEPLPTSKSAFKAHPVYVIPSLLGAAEVLVPDAKKRVCGVFKGELVFRRTDVTTLYPASKWPYRGRKVRPEELSKPTKRVKARKKPAAVGFKALRSYGVGKGNDGTEERRQKEIEIATKPLEDGMEDMYAIWQTEPWSPPPVGPNDRIPVTEFRNVELELLNPGLVHVDEPQIASVARQLGIPYAPCLVGFEGNGGNRAPTIRGIVVHAHNEVLLREAHAEMASHWLEESHQEHQRRLYLRWKRLLVGILTKDRLEREYGDEE